MDIRKVLVTEREVLVLILNLVPGASSAGSAAKLFLLLLFFKNLVLQSTGTRVQPYASGQ